MMIWLMMIMRGKEKRWLWWVIFMFPPPLGLSNPLSPKKSTMEERRAWVFEWEWGLRDGGCESEAWWAVVSWWVMSHFWVIFRCLKQERVFPFRFMEKSFRRLFFIAVECFICFLAVAAFSSFIWWFERHERHITDTCFLYIRWDMRHRFTHIYTLEACLWVIFCFTFQSFLLGHIYWVFHEIIIITIVYMPSLFIFY